MIIRVVGLRGAFERADFLQKVQQARDHHRATVQAFDPGAVYGERHLIAAAAKAVRAHREDRAIANDLATEILCYATGEVQISKALERAGLPGSGDAVVLVGLGDGIDAVLAAIGEAAGMRFAPDVITRDPAALDRIGVSAAMRGHVAPERWELLVLERVALVDAIK